MKEKNKILMHRIIWLCITLLFIFIPVISKTESVFGNICCALIPSGVLMVISTLLLSYKEYVVDGKTISVYAGFCHHTLKINGEIYDEHNTIITFTPITLSTTLENGSKIEATISLTNRISVKLNDKILQNN